jgi:hypothetical protein
LIFHISGTIFLLDDGAQAEKRVGDTYQMYEYNRYMVVHLVGYKEMSDDCQILEVSFPAKYL